MQIIYSHAENTNMQIMLIRYSRASKYVNMLIMQIRYWRTQNMQLDIREPQNIKNMLICKLCK